MQIILKLTLYDHKESLRQAMAGCISFRRKEKKFEQQITTIVGNPKRVF
jgi:hypothetical protein